MSLCVALALAACLNPRPEEVPGIDEQSSGAEPDNAVENPPMGAAGGAGTGGQRPADGSGGGSAGSSGSEPSPPLTEPADAGLGPATGADGGEPDGGL